MYYNKIRAVRWFWEHNSLFMSEFWAHNIQIRSDFERKIVRTMVSFLSDQRSFPTGKVWSETVLSAVSAHIVFRAHFSVIRGYFGLGWSDQRLLSSGTVWSEVTSV